MLTSETLLKTIDLLVGSCASRGTSGQDLLSAWPKIGKVLLKIGQFSTKIG